MNHTTTHWLATAAVLLSLSPAVLAQDHGHGHQPAEAADTPMAMPMTHEEHVDMSDASEPGLRDPHAYANGYERSSGPYALASQTQMQLADEQTFAGLWMDRFEFVDHDVTQGIELEGFAWFGNSYRQWIVQLQVETVEDDVEEGELDILYSRAISPFWNLRLGMHHSFGENTDRDWATIGIKGLAPYWIEVDSSLHIGDNGQAAFDLEMEYEMLLGQRLVLQPRLDIAAFAKNDAELGRGSGLSTIKAGARLRYEFDRQFAPYLGVERVSRFGKTLDFMLPGTRKTETHWVAGLRFWF